MAKGFSSFIRKLFAPMSKSADKASMYQQRAIDKADNISKGEKILAPHYPTEEKFLKEVANDPKIKEKINKKSETLIENLGKIFLTSKDAPEPSKTNRELPKRPWEYEHSEKQDYKYGFFEPPLEKIEKNRLMFREALEILHARMEIETVPENIRENHKANEVLKSHPVTKRVEKEKLDTVWEYFRPFSTKREQRVASKHSIEFIQKYIEGAEGDQIPTMAELITSTFAEEKKHLHERSRQSFPDNDELREIAKELKKEDNLLWEKVIEKDETERRRLEKRLKEELHEIGDETKQKTQN